VSHEAPLVSVLIVGYSRPDLLERTVSSFLALNTYSNIELILADDSSPPPMLERMKKLPFDRVVVTPRNLGLGANTNQGLAATRGHYVLQLQEDWVCKGPGDFIQVALEVVTRDPKLQFVRYSHFERTHPAETQRLHQRVVHICRSPPVLPTAFLYSDTPHLKSRSLWQQLGPYAEGRHMQRTEMDMRDRFNKAGHAAVFIEGYTEVFEHIGMASSFNTPLRLARIGRAMDRVPGLRQLASAYRRAKALLRSG
jgi:glycosyltransferase involved in cell wall biosynthesis